jgi:hypothetical protein
MRFAAKRRCNFMSALWKLQGTPNRICDLQRIAHEIARVTSPLVLGWVTAQMTRSLSAVRMCGEDTKRSYFVCLREISQNTSRMERCTFIFKSVFFFAFIDYYSGVWGSKHICYCTEYEIVCTFVCINTAI